jgi:2-phospho-L-lactate/phosphoenolpyruvate guanylyltransferase
VPTVVIPFAGAEGKTRLHAAAEVRRDLSLAMLADVLGAARAVGDVSVVTSGAGARALAVELGAAVVPDPGGGQGRAVQAGLAVAPTGDVLVVNADLPCATSADLQALIDATPFGAAGLVEAGDGTTNALRLSHGEVFAPLYGPGSAERFRAHFRELGIAHVTVDIPNLVEDVDTLPDLERLLERCGPRTHACLERLSVEARA